MKPQGTRWSLAAVLVALGLAVALAAPSVRGQDLEVASGTVVELAPSLMTVETNAGPVVVVMDDNTTYEREDRVSLADVLPGDFVGVTARLLGDRLSGVALHVFSAIQTNVRQGQSPMSGPNAGNLMTNAIVTSVGDGQITLRFGDQDVTIDTPSGIQVTRPLPGTAADVREGVRVTAAGTREGDGTLRAAAVYVRLPQ